tara:strand:- start:139 stop:387 length:249 start_codon:yes stop_codon:yes gene_type:complete
MRSLALIAHHPGEDVITYGPRFNRIRRYILHDIKGLTGLSLDEFLNRPREEVEFIFSLSTELVRKKNQSAGKLADELDGLSK